MLIESYILTHNSPKRLRDCLTRMSKADCKFLQNPICVIDQSTIRDISVENFSIAMEFGTGYKKNKNLGASGGRWYCAQLHHESNADAMFYFEDDLVFNTDQLILNSFGFPALLSDPFDLAVEAVKSLNLGYIKYSFQEHFGNHTVVWPSGRRATYELHRVRNCNFFLGEVYFCNWPMLITKACSKLIFNGPPKSESEVAIYFEKLAPQERVWRAVFAADMIIHSNLDTNRHDDIDLRV